MASDNGGANFLVGFFVGAAMGVMGALLLAPKSGRELRDELVDEGRKLRDRAVDEGRRDAGSLRRGRQRHPRAQRSCLSEGSRRHRGNVTEAAKENGKKRQGSPDAELMATLPRDDDALVEPDGSDGSRSTFSLLRDVVVNLTHVVEDSTDLLTASVREELAHFRVDFARHALSLVAVIIGGSLATAGLALLVNQWIDNWAVTLLIFGGIYLAFAAGLQWGRAGTED